MNKFALRLTGYPGRQRRAVAIPPFSRPPPKDTAPCRSSRPETPGLHGQLTGTGCHLGAVPAFSKLLTGGFDKADTERDVEAMGISNAKKWPHDGLVDWVDCDTAYLSVAFTWKLDDAYQRAAFYRAQGLKVRAGGPGIFTRKHYLADVAEIGGDMPDAIARHNPLATFASRGCPVGCWFCIVPKMEGKAFTLLPDFPVRPFLCDNNLSALPADYQDHIVSRYTAAGVPLLDANSGFEPRTFDEEVFRRWAPINRGPWRFAYDDMGDREHVQRVMKMLRAAGVSKSKIRVYTLIGNEPVNACLGRIREVIQWGGEPHAQPVMKLNTLSKEPMVRFDWTSRELTDMARWANCPPIWRKTDYADYRRSAKTIHHDAAQGNLLSSCNEVTP